MSDISLKIKAKELGKEIENLSLEITKELEQAVDNIAHATHAFIIAQAQQKMNSTRIDYLSGLEFLDMGNNSYIITLNGDWANKLENGFAPYNMKETLLKSKSTVKTGSRAGEPWVRVSKKGNKYAAVPFQKSVSSKSSGNLIEDIKNLTAKNSAGREQKLTKIFKDDKGVPISGKAASSKSENPLLNNITKYQHVGKSGKVSSVYMTYRIISENSSGWIHPGHHGVQFFKAAEEYVDKEFENIINTLIK